MDFYKLTDFQLYSIINSRHLDAAQKAAAEKELERRNLSPEELQHFADELASRQHQTKWSAKLISRVWWLLIVMVVIILLRQLGCR